MATRTWQGTVHGVGLVLEMKGENPIDGFTLLVMKYGRPRLLSYEPGHGDWLIWGQEKDAQVIPRYVKPEQVFFQWILALPAGMDPWEEAKKHPEFCAFLKEFHEFRKASEHALKVAPIVSDPDALKRYLQRVRKAMNRLETND